MGLDTIRQEIDTVDTEMKELFLKRMELAYQVVESKKQTGGAVYVQEREKEIVAARSEGIEQEYLPEYQAFIKQLMGISRTYQYSKMINESEKLQDMPEGVGEMRLDFPYRPGTDNLSVCLNAIALAGLSVKEVAAGLSNDQSTCRICIYGDFSTELAKAAVLLILEENK